MHKEHYKAYFIVQLIVVSLKLTLALMHIGIYKPVNLFSTTIWGVLGQYSRQGHVKDNRPETLVRGTVSTVVTPPALFQILCKLKLIDLSDFYSGQGSVTASYFSCKEKKEYMHIFNVADTHILLQYYIIIQLQVRLHAHTSNLVKPVCPFFSFCSVLPRSHNIICQEITVGKLQK